MWKQNEVWGKILQQLRCFCVASVLGCVPVTPRYGGSYAIIFRPSGVNSYENSTYKVIVSGVQKENGEKVKIEFITQFFDLWR